MPRKHRTIDHTRHLEELRKAHRELEWEIEEELRRADGGRWYVLQELKRKKARLKLRMWHLDAQPTLGAA